MASLFEIKPKYVSQLLLCGVMLDDYLIIWADVYVQFLS